MGGTKRVATRGTFELKKTNENRIYFDLKAANGVVILTSYPYASKDAARAGIEAVRERSQRGPLPLEDLASE